MLRVKLFVGMLFFMVVSCTSTSDQKKVTEEQLIDEIDAALLEIEDPGQSAWIQKEDKLPFSNYSNDFK